MFEICNYTLNELQELLKGKTEISQELNHNAYTRLFIIDEKTVVKIFVSSPELAVKNIDNLLLMRNRDDLEVLSELTMPTELIRIQNEIIGYSMPYIQGCTLNKFLTDKHISDKFKISAFKQLACLICSMPEDIFIGDLHGENVLIDSNYKIHLIDIDGFSLKDGHCLTVPQSAPNIVGKYIDDEGNRIISRNSDIYCFYNLFLNWIADSPFAMSDFYRVRYIQYLKENGFPLEIYEDVCRQYQSLPNTLHFHVSTEWNSRHHCFCFKQFLNKTGLDVREKEAEKILDQYLLSADERN